MRAFDGYKGSSSLIAVEGKEENVKFRLAKTEEETEENSSAGTVKNCEEL
jgi:hypothetical protein